LQLLGEADCRMQRRRRRTVGRAVRAAAASAQLLLFGWPQCYRQSPVPFIPVLFGEALLVVAERAP
jgi:hypothetical protein